MPQLIVFRIIQGLGAAALFPIGMTIIADMLSLEQRTKIIGLFSGLWGVASLVGPIVGGYLTAYTKLSWRWCFYIILPFGLLAGGLIGWAYRERYERSRKITLDYWGAATLTAALVLLLLIVERGADFSWPFILAGVCLCAAMFIVFIGIERKHPEPLLPLTLFKNRIVALATLHGFFGMMALIGTMSYLPLFVQAVIGTNAAEAGKILIPLIIPWVISSIIGGRLILRFGYRPLVLIGTVLMLIGAAMLAMVSVETTRLRLSFDVIFLGLGGGLTIVTLMIAAQHAVARTQLGITTSTVQFARSIGAAMGAAVMGSLMSWRLTRLLANAPAEIAHLANKHEIGSIVRPESRASLSASASDFLQQSLASSLRLAFTYVLVAVAAAAVISLFIPGGSAYDHAHDPTQANQNIDAAAETEMATDFHN
jgi:MFS family permease